jgi:outer membrane protein OmpA-like peptidoglycan-associated protein
VKKIIILILALSLMSACTPINKNKQKINPGINKNSTYSTKAIDEKSKTKPLVNNGASSYMDGQEKLLKKKLKQTKVRVIRESNNLKIIMPASVTFEINSSYITASFYPILTSISEVLNKWGNTKLKIYGYSDEQGSFEHNQLLSEDRARSIASYLIHQGVNTSRLYVQGMSERFPIATNTTKEGRALNRRVELIIKPVYE